MNVFGDLQREIAQRPGDRRDRMSYAEAMTLRDRARMGQPCDKEQLAEAAEIVAETRRRMCMGDEPPYHADLQEQPEPAGEPEICRSTPEVQEQQPVAARAPRKPRVPREHAPVVAPERQPVDFGYVPDGVCMVHLPVGSFLAEVLLPKVGAVGAADVELDWALAGRGNFLTDQEVTPENYLQGGRPVLVETPVSAPAPAAYEVPIFSSITADTVVAPAPTAPMVVAPSTLGDDEDGDDYLDEQWTALFAAVPNLDEGEAPASAHEIWEKAGRPEMVSASRVADLLSDYGMWDIGHEVVIRADGTPAYRFCGDDDDCITAAQKSGAIRYLQAVAPPNRADLTNEGSCIVRRLDVTVVDFYHGNP